MKIFIKNTGQEVDLPDTYISGGEGDVYVKDDWAYKIYHDIKKTLNEEKFEELKKLEKSNIIKPENLIYNNKGIAIGYMMKAIPKCFPLSRLVTNDFRNQYNISSDKILKIIQQMKETFEYIHSKGCLVIDGNEMNYLVDENFETVYFIDVDSYQTQKHNANAYSPSTLDPIAEKNRKFSIFSDWFIFAVVSCTLLVGIHPFKGSYKGISQSFKKGDIKSRMVGSISIFNNKVNVNSAVRDFSIIPSHYKNWFVELFENNFRIAPPSDIFDVTVNFNRKERVLSFNGKVKSKNIYKNKESIMDAYLSEFNNYVRFNDYIVNTNDNKINKFKNIKTEFIEIDKKAFLIKLDQTIKMFSLCDDEIIDTSVISNSAFVIDNRIYSIYGNKLNELKFYCNKLIINNSWDILGNNTDLFKNILIQKIYNRNIIYIPFETQSCAIINMKELQDCKIINANYQNRMLELVVFKNNQYKRMIFKFDEHLVNYKCIFEDETENLDINFVTLDNGVFISSFKDEEFLLTLNKKDKDDITIVNDSNINNTNKLIKNKNNVYLIVDKEINQISLT